MQQAKFCYSIPGEPTGIGLRHLKNANCSMHLHAYNELFYLLEGEAAATIDGQTRILTAGECVLVTNFELHSYSCDAPVDAAVMFVSDDYLEFLGIYHGALEFSDHFFRPCEAAAGYLRALISETRGDSAFMVRSVVCDTLIFMLLCELCRSKPSVYSKDRKKQCEENKSNELVKQALIYISMNYHQKLTLTGVAAKFGFGGAYFGRLMKKKLEMTFVDFLNRQRMNDAMWALINTDKSVSRIALDSGFGTIRNFNKVFRRYCPKTPTEYREQQKE